MRKTFTDYLDDVSTVYPDPTILQSEKSSESVIFSDKSGNPNLLYVTSKHDSNNNGYIAIVPAGRLISLGKHLQYYTNRRVLGKLEGKIVDTTPIIEMVLMKSV